jgi:hypothetical protein
MSSTSVQMSWRNGVSPTSKQLWETAQRGQMSHSGGFQGPVGPMAILDRKLGQEDV